MHYTSIEQMLQMTRGGTVSGRAPTIIGDAILDAKSGDGPQIDMAKETLFEAMRNAESPAKLSPEERNSLTEAELTELSTGEVDGVLSHIRAKLIKRAKSGREGSMKNIANYAQKKIMNLGESNLKPGDMNQGSYAEQKPRMIKSGYSLGEFALKGGSTKQAQTMQPGHHRGVDAGDPIGEWTETDKPCPRCNGKGQTETMPATQDFGPNSHKPVVSTCSSCKGTGKMRVPGGPLKKANENVEEAATSDSDNSKGAKAAGERKFDKVWGDVDSEAKRIAGVASRTGLKAPLKEAIAAFQETVELSDALSEYNTASGKVSGQKVYTDPVATMAINSAYRTDLLKLSSGKSAMAGKPGSVKSRGIKPGDPIGEDEIAEGSANLSRQVKVLHNLNKALPKGAGASDEMMAHARKAGGAQLRQSDRQRDTPAGKVTRGTKHQSERGFKTKGRSHDSPEMGSPEWVKLRASFTKDRLSKADR